MMEDRGLINETPFAAQELYLSDEEGRELLTVVVKATYAIHADGRLQLAEEQRPVEVAGTYNGDPETSSPRYEPEVAPKKPATDVVLIGHAHAPHAGTVQLDVSFQVGPVRKTIRVFGDRYWFTRMGFRVMSDPAPFWKIPLIYERAFGGWDHSPSDPNKHTVERRNPVGVGYYPKRFSSFVEGAPVPNLEDPRHLIGSPTDSPPPAGFGFIGPGWAPRLNYAGTYDDAWMQNRMPLLPIDFDRRFYNAAPADQIVPGYLRGDEHVVVLNASPEGRLSFKLPGTPPPQCLVEMQDETLCTLESRLDTVIIDTDEAVVVLIWRAHSLLRSGFHAVRSIRVISQPSSNQAATARAAVAAN
jgi:hypothetical protein